jgi:tetratricopeptide (TPR) repeat protein
MQQAIQLLTQAVNFQEKSEFESAEVLMRKALKILKEQYHDDKAEQCFNAAMQFQDGKRIQLALDMFMKSYDYFPSRMTFDCILRCLMHLRQYEKMWEFYEKRFDLYDTMIAYRRIFKDRAWDGVASLEGKRLLVFCEQGLGDQIMFVPYIQELQKRFNCQIVLSCAGKLEKLFNLQGFQTIPKEHISTDCMPEFDFHTTSMSLPKLLKIFEPIPQTNTFNIETKWELDSFKIGIIAKGNPNSFNDIRRNVNPKWFQKILNENVQLYNLHNSEPVYDPNIIELGPRINDIYDLAVMINSMDLIITVETVVFPLAAAMGKNVWVLSPYLCDWRFGISGDQTPWYPSVKLYRQTNLQDWGSVFDSINHDLIKYIQEVK